jgi:lipoate-protein ligase A
MYSVVLRYDGRQHLRLIDQAHRHVLGIVGSALQSLALAADHCGTSDLALGGRKFSGNSLRCKRDHVLYHGTLLYEFDLTLVERLLQMPPRMPDYRTGRSHGEFVMNLDADRTHLVRAMTDGFGATAALDQWPQTLTQQLAESRYAKEEWNRSR